MDNGHEQREIDLSRRMRKRPTSFNLDEEDRTIIAILADENGISKTDVVRQAIRQLAMKLAVRL